MADLFSSDLSERLNLTRDEGEKWIVNLIRETKMGSEAKIDLEKVRFDNLLLSTMIILIVTSPRTSSRLIGHHFQFTNMSSKRLVDFRSAHRP